MDNFENQMAVVTGASSGIGRAIALRLAAEGANLCLVGRALESLQAVLDAAPAKAARNRCLQADLSVGSDVDQLVAAIRREVGSVDILVHAAGVLSLGSVEAATAGQLDCHYYTNVRAPYALTHGLLPALKARPGQVLFVNSSAGLTAKGNASHYAASKHALKALADSLREEVNPAGIRVLSLYLGRTATPMQAAVHAAEGKPYRPELLMQPQDVASMAVYALALPHGVEVTDISMRPALKTY